jgi:hypothetical protein
MPRHTIYGTYWDPNKNKLTVRDEAAASSEKKRKKKGENKKKETLSPSSHARPQCFRHPSSPDRNQFHKNNTGRAVWEKKTKKKKQKKEKKKRKKQPTKHLADALSLPPGLEICDNTP